MKLECPCCGGVRQRHKYLCVQCWYLLPEDTRSALYVRDGKAILRLQKLYGDLADGKLPQQIQISA